MIIHLSGNSCYNFNCVTGILSWKHSCILKENTHEVTNPSSETSETGTNLNEPEPEMNSGEKGETTTEYDVDNSSGLHQIGEVFYEKYNIRIIFVFIFNVSIIKL